MGRKRGAKVTDKEPRSRDTVRPAFDVERFAEESEARERLPTLLDESTTEQARLASVLMDSTPPRAPGLPIVKEPEPARPPGAPVAMEPEPFEDVSELGQLRARLSPLSRVPTLARSLTQLGAAIDDPRTAYVLGFVDGLLPLDTIVEVAGLPELDTLRILDRAVDRGVLSFRSAG